MFWRPWGVGSSRLDTEAREDPNSKHQAPEKPSFSSRLGSEHFGRHLHAQALHLALRREEFFIRRVLVGREDVLRAAQVPLMKLLLFLQDLVHFLFCKVIRKITGEFALIGIIGWEFEFLPFIAHLLD